MAYRQLPLAAFAVLLAAVSGMSRAQGRAQTTDFLQDHCESGGAGGQVPGELSAAPVRQPADWAWLCRYRSENRRLLGSQPPRAVFIGDSITEHWISADTQFFGDRWAGRGIAGQTSSQILLRFQQDAIALKPKVIHLLVGANDVARNTGALDAQAYQANIRSMVDLACANNITLVLGTILPAEKFYWRGEVQPVEAIRALNRWLSDFAAMRRIKLVDYYAAMATPEGGMRKGLSEDGVHPNREGYRVMRRSAEAALADALAGTRRQRGISCAGRKRV